MLDSHFLFYCALNLKKKKRKTWENNDWTRIFLPSVCFFLPHIVILNNKKWNFAGKIQNAVRLAGYPFAPPNTPYHTSTGENARDKQIVYTTGLTSAVWCWPTSSSLHVSGTFQMCIYKSNRLSMATTESKTHGCICCFLLDSSCQSIPRGRRRGTHLSDGCHCAPGRWRAWVYI